ncbi:MAG: hypothetical protein VKJ06_01590 [Vampirovibrionales bacterium]|nr:hypothetical protein [Vampirovibrionales bacterium]
MTSISPAGASNNAINAVTQAVKKPVGACDVVKNLVGGAISLPGGIPYYGSATHPLRRSGNKALQLSYLLHKAATQLSFAGAASAVGLGSLAIPFVGPFLSALGVSAGVAMAVHREGVEWVANPDQRKMLGEIFNTIKTKGLGGFFEKAYKALS